MRPKDKTVSKEIERKLVAFGKKKKLPGIELPESRICLIEQIIDSIRRVKYVTVIREKIMSDIFCNATSEHFDPLKAAIFQKQNGNLDEAFWLVFLATHFGKNKRTGWALAKGTYGAFEHPVYWDWITTSSNINAFRFWLKANQIKLKKLGNFSNHRKYQSIDAYSLVGTGEAVASYINWIGDSHVSFIEKIKQTCDEDPRVLFDVLYRSMNSVVSFGRTARFDYLTMVGKLGLLDIEPNSTYMEGATGPKSGAKLLFAGSLTASLTEKQLNEYLKQLEEHLGLYFGMQILEDALCNWQKSPFSFKHFTG